MAEKMGVDFQFIKRGIAKKVRNIGWHRFGIFSRFSGEKDDWNLIWVMNSNDIGLYTYRNSIPIFLDTPVKTVDMVLKATKSLPFFWVTCMDFFRILEAHGCTNAHYMPLSISDKYITDVVPEKKIDVLQFGRKNDLLHEWMLRYCREHDNVEYVYQTGNGTLTYTSTVRGEIGRFDSRKEYMELMRSAKISLVSTPGCDENRDFGGVDFVTPRFYESAACYCQMLGRYTENEEVAQIGIKSICPNISNFEEFKRALALNLENDIDAEKYETFCRINCTSQRVKEMLKVIQSE